MQFSSKKRVEVGGDGSPVSSRAAAVIVPCSSRKSTRPGLQTTAVSLPQGNQNEVETAWLERLKGAPQVCRAGSLYAGRAIRLGKDAAAFTGGDLFIVSAGLGLVPAEQIVPSYGLTVSGRGPESIGPRIRGHFDIESWWEIVSRGPFSTAFCSIFRKELDLPVLIALTKPYARLLAPVLDRLEARELERVRIFGTGLTEALSERVCRQVLPYDARLENVLPGTKADFPQRALLHFAGEGLGANPSGNVSEHRAWVEVAFAGQAAPIRPARPRLSDARIIELIAKHLPETRAVGRLLRVLRDHEGVACEQARFTRLYRTALERRVA